ncbi:MFS transporter [Patescibacteria group bacterium]
MKTRLIPVYLLTFVNTIGFTILIPVLPFIVDQYHGGALTYGFLLSAYSLSQFLATPLIGSLSDKFGRRPTLLISQAGTLLSWVIFGIAYFLPNIGIAGIALPIIIIGFSRITDGITGGNISVTNAYIADITAPKERTKIYGQMGAVMGFGFIIGPVLGGFSATTSIGYFGTVLTAAFISLVTLILIYLYLAESLTDENRVPHLEIHLLKELNILGRIREVSENGIIKKLFIKRFFFSFAFACFTATFALYAMEFLELSVGGLGVLMLVIGIFSIINHAVIVHQMEKIFQNEKTFFIGQIIMTIGMALIALKPDLTFFIILMFISNLGLALSMTTLKTMVTNESPPGKLGRITGIDESITAGNNGIAPIFASFIYGFITFYAYGIFALFLLMPLIICPLIKSKKMPNH